jgi:hypothetical protein
MLDYEQSPPARTTVVVEIISKVDGALQEKAWLCHSQFCQRKHCEFFLQATNAYEAGYHSQCKVIHLPDVQYTLNVPSNSLASILLR